MQRLLFLGLMLSAGLAACAAPEEARDAAVGRGPGMGMGMGMGGGMMQRHSAPIPAEYAGAVNPILADDESLARGAEVYATHCASCHGEAGMGDGPAGAALDPAPAPVAHTSQMMGDDYLLWRLREGGAPFSSAMPAWKETLDEQAQWDVINYVRALGRGGTGPGLRGAPEAQATRQADMLAQAVAEGVLSEAEAQAFQAVHDRVEAYMAENVAALSGTGAERQAAALAAMVESGTLTQAEADLFGALHDRLEAAGLIQ